MILIFGGAYQGKLAFAEEKFGVTEGEISTVEGKNLDFPGKILCGLENFTHACTLEGMNGDISGYALTLSELVAAIALAVI